MNSRRDQHSTAGTSGRQPSLDSFPLKSARIRHKKIDWKALHGVDVDKVVNTTNTATIQQITDALVCGDISMEDKHNLSAFNFVQVIRLLQLATEYLWHLHDLGQQQEERLQGCKAAAAKMHLCMAQFIQEGKKEQQAWHADEGEASQRAEKTQSYWAELEAASRTLQKAQAVVDRPELDPPFHFRSHHMHINWQQLHSYDAAELAEEGDLAAILPLLPCLTYGDIDSEDTAQLSAQNFMQMTQLCQCALVCLHSLSQDSLRRKEEAERQCSAEVKKVQKLHVSCNECIQQLNACRKKTHRPAQHETYVHLPSSPVAASRSEASPGSPQRIAVDHAQQQYLKSRRFSEASWATGQQSAPPGSPNRPQTAAQGLASCAGSPGSRMAPSQAASCHSRLADEIEDTLREEQRQTREIRSQMAEMWTIVAKLRSSAPEPAAPALPPRPPGEPGGSSKIMLGGLEGMRAEVRQQAEARLRFQVEEIKKRAFEDMQQRVTKDLERRTSRLSQDMGTLRRASSSGGPPPEELIRDLSLLRTRSWGADGYAAGVTSVRRHTMQELQELLKAEGLSLAPPSQGGAYFEASSPKTSRLSRLGSGSPQTAKVRLTANY